MKKGVSYTLFVTLAVALILAVIVIVVTGGRFKFFQKTTQEISPGQLNLERASCLLHLNRASIDGDKIPDACDICPGADSDDDPDNDWIPTGCDSNPVDKFKDNDPKPDCCDGKTADEIEDPTKDCPRIISLIPFRCCPKDKKFDRAKTFKCIPK